MRHADGPPASASRASRRPDLVVGLAERDASTPVARYFAAFRWEPPAIDPAYLTASAFLALLDDVGVDGVERALLPANKQQNDRGAANE